MHDNRATEAMGPLYEHSREHLGYGDRAIIAARQTLLAALKDSGKPLPFRCAERQAMRDILNEIVVASMITPDKNRYKELFLERQQAARAQAIAQ